MSASGDLTRTTVLLNFRRHSEAAVGAAQPRVVLNLLHVQQADSKLVASLLIILRQARAEQVNLDIKLSPVVREWIALYKLERLLCPPK